MSTQIIEHQEELLIKDKTEDIISCKNQIPLNAKNVEINAVNTTQIVVPDSSTDRASEKTNEKIIEKISNNQQKQEIQKPLTVQDWDYDDLVQFLPDPQVEPPEIYGGNLDQNYRFVQYHFHWAQNDNEGSEHCIGGLRYPAELHLVHKGVEDENKLAVLGIFIKLDDAKNDDGKVKKRYIFEKQEMEALKELTEFGNKKALDSNHCLELKLPPNCCVERENFKGAETFTSSFVRYQGSLTTPPCTENVHWTIFTDPVFITKEQLSYLRKIKDCRGNVILKNYRPGN
uniref:Carbonic anhydrase n=1 Tax=Meloidogyne javanica TaxID=6303 RepID=A0A915NBM6_MELJA